MTVLHITNGDSAAGTIRATGLEGDVLAWRDPMHHGPFRPGASLAEQSEVRAQYLAGPGVDFANTLRDFTERDARLRAAAACDEIVLWFEHDLLDQLQLLQLLDWFATADLGDTRLSLICIGAFDGIDPFRGLGQLDATQMASLWPGRLPVTQDQLDLARHGWTAFCSPDPHDLVAFLDGDLSALGHLEAALKRHMEDYPAFGSGLTRTEHQILEIVAGGVSRPADVFRENVNRETALFLGDWRTFEIITDLTHAAEPLLADANGAPCRFGLDNSAFARGLFRSVAGSDRGGP